MFCRGGAGIFTSTLNILGKYICMVYGCTVDCTDKENYGIDGIFNTYAEKYGDKIYICTNYGFRDEDFKLTHWRDLLSDYDKPVILAMMKYRMSSILVTIKISLSNW